MLMEKLLKEKPDVRHSEDRIPPILWNVAWLQVGASKYGEFGG